ncbi:protein gamma response 1 isoform X1 [Prosopis cineraria]|uniref:protein gamma response 1 isoform X1 n=1 Tax=Prosopis cineraria TaxID=364024 RepID=UPI00240F6908|nr:protein gamma response 1 isoform X1 [Prosopis cineraria]
MDALERSLKSPKLGYPAGVDGDDDKVISGLSTVLVASIQEAKDRISQIELIFCRKLYPNFQSKSKTLHKFYSEARKSLEVQWKEKENELLLQIEKMRLENQRVLEENRLLNVEEAKVKELEKELRARQLRIEELEREIRKKNEEIEEGLMLHKNLVDLVQSKESLILDREGKLEQYVEKTKGSIARVKELEGENEDLKLGLREKDEKMAAEIKLRETLHANNLELTSVIEGSEKERKRLLAQIVELNEESTEIRKKLSIKTLEFEEKEEMQGQLIKQIEVQNSELLENKKKLDVHEKEKELLLEKMTSLEEKLNLPYKPSTGRGESSDGVDSYRRVLKDVESISSELQAERKKRLHVTEAYKRLKSQHNYLREKVGLTSENMLPDKLENESDLSKHKNPITAPGIENKIPDTFVAACDLNNVKEEIFEDDRGIKTIPHSSSFRRGPKCPTNTKSASLSGTKRPASSWRQTRSRQSRVGNDPHDDFLDTPLENVRANLNKGSNKEDLPEPVQKDVSMGNSDDETQDVNAKSNPLSKKSSVPLANKKSFKYIEPVRKKAEREKLKGIECKQCKKFYDAVLSSEEGKDPDSSKQNFRCEHLDGVSRHRYRYAPPMTPEGFWNIGFESEL